MFPIEIMSLTFHIRVLASVSVTVFLKTDRDCVETCTIITFLIIWYIVRVHCFWKKSLMLPKTAFIWSKMQYNSNTVKYYYNFFVLKSNFINSSWIFAVITSFRNHSNMPFCCSKQLLLNIFVQTSKLLIFSEFFDEKKFRRTAFIWNRNLL